MKFLKLAAVVALASAVCACSTIPGVAGSGGADVAKGVLTNLEHCDRTYTAAIGAGGGGSLNVSCKARPWEAPVAAPVAPADVAR
jgi:hypothetical protein